jgi:hypothetical protein
MEPIPSFPLAVIDVLKISLLATKCQFKFGGAVPAKEAKVLEKQHVQRCFWNS